MFPYNVNIIFLISQLLYMNTVSLNCKIMVINFVELHDIAFKICDQICKKDHLSHFRHFQIFIPF